jgi:hypothetical protein
MLSSDVAHLLVTSAGVSSQTPGLTNAHLSASVSFQKGRLSLSEIDRSCKRADLFGHRAAASLEKTASDKKLVREVMSKYLKGA